MPRQTRMIEEPVTNVTLRIRRLMSIATVKEYLVELLIMILTAATHLYNLGNFPSFFIDEGTYIEFGIVFSRTGNPAGPLGNFFFHPFLGWILLGAYFALVGVPQAWSSSPVQLYAITRGMPTLLSIAEVPMVYLVVRRVYSRRDYALLATGLFAVTPLSVRYLRMDLLDNFMLFFLLLSLTLLTVGKPNRNTFVSSGVAYGLSVMCKLPALFFLPAFLVFFVSKDRSKIKFPFMMRKVRNMIVWAAIAGLTTIVWPVYAVLSGHTGDLLANLGYESVRTGELALSLIVQRLVQRDIFLFVGFAGILYGLYKRDIPGLLFTISYVGIFLLRGLRVSSYYLIPVLPFLAILAALLIVDAVEALHKATSPRLPISKPALVRLVSLLLILGLATASILNASDNASSGQSAAISYLVANAPQGSLIISSPAYSWTLQAERKDLLAFDWFSAPWNSLPHSSRTYLIVDPGFETQVQEVPQLSSMYNQTLSIAYFPGTVPVEIRSTNATVTI